MKRKSSTPHVYNWSDYIEPSLIEQFEKETGIKVNYEVMDDNALLETKLRAGRTGYDIVVPSASFLANQIKSSIYQKLDKSKLKNLRQPGSGDPEEARGLRPRQSLCRELHVGHLGVAYNEEKIKEIDPNAPVNSFAIFYDPNEIRKFQKCGVSVLDASTEVIGTVSDVPGQGRQQREHRRPQGRREGADVDPALYPHDQFLRLHRQPRQRRSLPGAGLVG